MLYVARIAECIRVAQLLEMLVLSWQAPCRIGGPAKRGQMMTGARG